MANDTISRAQAAQAEKDRNALERQREKIKAEEDRAQKDRDFKIEAAKLLNDAELARQMTGTNSVYNMQLLRQEAAANKPTVTVTETLKDGTTVRRNITPAQNAAEIKSRNAPELAKLESELKTHQDKIAANDERYGLFNLFSRQNKVADLNGKIAGLQPPPDVLAADPVAAAVAAAAPVAPIQTKAPLSFSGTTSWSGPGIAPVPSRGFIGTPGGQNLFIDPTEAAAAQLVPSRGDVQMAESAATPAPAPVVEPIVQPAQSALNDPVAAAAAEFPTAAAPPAGQDVLQGRPPVVSLEDPLLDTDPVDQNIVKGRPLTVNLEDGSTDAPAAAKIVIQKGQRFKLNPDGSSEHLGPVAK